MTRENVAGKTRFPDDWPEHLDAMISAPDHHEILLENDQVRVLDTRVGPGDSTPVHTHQWPSVLYVLEWSDFVRRDPEGGTLLDSRTFGSAPVPGTVLWSDPLPPHSATNVGQQELRVIAIELKTPHGSSRL